MSFESLFRVLDVGSLMLPNRIIMAPLTRARATIDNVPSALMGEYYAQRADCGLIVSEATAVDPLGMGWYRVPGIWNEHQIRGWQEVTRRVHERDGRIFAQLWHMGRLVLPDYIGGGKPIGPSAIAGEGTTMAPPTNNILCGPGPMKPYVVPRAMTYEDIFQVVAAYRRAAVNAARAGFDGVEIHAANGYLIDQFLQSKSNRRMDRYGGGVMQRTRLLEEVLAAVTSVLPAGRVGIRISPTSGRKGVGDENPAALAEAVAQIAQDMRIGYLHLIEPIVSGFMDKPLHPVIDKVRATYGGVLVHNGSFDGPTADACIAAGKADAVSFGRPYIANPDLVTRIRDGIPLAVPNFDFAYIGDARGYIDYPPARVS